MKNTILILSTCLVAITYSSGISGNNIDFNEGQLFANLQEQKTGSFGEKITSEGAVDVASVYLAEPGKEGVKIKVKGEILEVCQSMGCWVTLKLPDNKSIRVSTEHKFFLPKDISGYTAIVQGTLSKKLTSVEDLRHFAEESGKDEDYINSITEPQEEYSIEAAGMLVLEKKI